MRHVLLTEQWFPHIGGSIHLFDEIYGKRFPADDAVSIVAGSAPGDALADANYPRPVTRFDATRYLWMRPESLAAYARMSFAVARASMRGRADVVHCARVIPEGLVGLMLKRAFGVPYVVWVHGEEVSMYLRYWGKRALMPEILREARGVICNSSFSRGQAHMAGAPTERLHVINPCVDTSRFDEPVDTEALRARLGVTGKTVVLSVGRLTRRKGHDHVLQALARLRPKNVVYLILSDGELEGELHNLARELKLGDLVRFVGPVPTAELPKYYAACDLFIMANRTLRSGDVEGFGMVFLEASAAGRAVIGGRSGGVVDAVLHEETGLLVDGSSVTDIAEALQRLLDDPGLRERLGARGHEWTRQKFSWERAARRVREIAEGNVDPSVWHDPPARQSVMVPVVEPRAGISARG